MKHLTLFEDFSSDDYFKLYHATDSEFFTQLDFNKSDKIRFHNPLGNGLYLSPDKENIQKHFGKNLYVYYLPKSSNIKFVSKENFKNDYYNVLRKVLKKIGKKYEDLPEYQKRNIENNYKFQNAAIIMLNRLTRYLAEIFGIDADKMADIIENIMNKENSKYDAIWYDYGEVLIPTEKFKSQYFKNNI